MKSLRFIEIKLMKRLHNKEIKMIPQKVFIILFIFCSVGCSTFKNDQEIEVSVNNNDLFFNFKDQETNLSAYVINSLELREEDGLTYKNILNYQNYDGFRNVLIKNYKERNIIDNHAYYLRVSKKSGSRFKTLGFCLNKKSVLLRENNKEGDRFIERCHNFKGKQ